MQQKGHSNESETEIFDVIVENNTASRHAENITETDISYANIKTNGTKLAANDTLSKRLTQPRVGKERVRRDVSAEMDGENNEAPRHVIRTRQTKTDTVYDWSVDELSDSEIQKWHVDRIDPNEKVRIQCMIVILTP